MSESKIVSRPLAGYGLLTVAEAAERRGWNVRTVQKWIQTGKIPVVIVGEGRNVKYLLDVKDVDAFETPPMGRPKSVPAKKSRARK